MLRLSQEFMGCRSGWFSSSPSLSIKDYYTKCLFGRKQFGLHHKQTEECTGKISLHIHAGKMRVLAIGCCWRHSAGSAWLFPSMNRSSFLNSRNHPQSLPLKGPRHLLHFHQGQSYELDMVFHQPKVRLLPTTITAIRPITWVPNSTETPSLEFSDSSYAILEQRFSFPARSWISLWQAMHLV